MQFDVKTQEALLQQSLRDLDALAKKSRNQDVVINHLARVLGTQSDTINNVVVQCASLIKILIKRFGLTEEEVQAEFDLVVDEINSAGVSSMKESAKAAELAAQSTSPPAENLAEAYPHIII